MTRLLVASLALAACTACPWRGVDDLTRDANLVVVVTGVDRGDVIALEVGARRSRLTVDERHGALVELYAQLPVGVQAATLEHHRDEDRRCVRFDVDIRAGAVERFAWDVRAMTACDDDDDDDAGPTADGGSGDAGPPDGGAGGDAGGDAGPPPDAGEPDEDGGDDDDGDAGEAIADAGAPVDDGGDEDPAEDDAGQGAGDGGSASPTFRRLEEHAPVEGCTQDCEEESTRIEDDGLVIFVDADGLAYADYTLSDEELAALVADVMSAAADALFARADASCPDSSLEEAVELRRMRAGSSEGEQELHLDPSACTSPIAAALRAHLRNAREKALATGDGGS